MAKKPVKPIRKPRGVKAVKFWTQDKISSSRLRVADAITHLELYIDTPGLGPWTKTRIKQEIEALKEVRLLLLGAYRANQMPPTLPNEPASTEVDDDN